MTQGLDRYFGLSIRTVLLTGTTRAIGLALMEAFVEAGAKLVIAGNEAEECVTLGEQLRSRGYDKRRCGEPWEVAAAALFLAGPGSGFMTGQTWVVDCGTVISDGN